MCRKLGLADLPFCKDLYRNNVLSQCKKIRDDMSHPLHQFYVTLPSGRRMKSVPARTERYRLSFVPHSIIISKATLFFFSLVDGSADTSVVAPTKK